MWQQLRDFLFSEHVHADCLLHGAAQVLLQYVGQMMRLYLASATDATARGMAAAGVEVGLPEEVCCVPNPKPHAMESTSGAQIDNCAAL